MNARQLAPVMPLLMALGRLAQADPSVLLVRPESPPLVQVTNNVFDLSDDLGCVWWSGVTNTGKGGRTASQIFGTSADGRFNSNLINTALNEGKSIGDKHGRYFPVAASSEAQPYAIRIPSAGIRYGGTIQGTGFLQRGTIPAGLPGNVHSNAGTTFVCTTDPSVVPYSKQGMIAYRGVGWRIGPINLIGRYFLPASGGIQAVKDGEVAKYGLHCIGPPSGEISGAVACFYLQEGITSDRDASNTWYELQFEIVKDCVVSNDLQTVNNRVMKITIDENCGTVFKFPHGGTLQCDQVAWNKPATLLEIGAAPWGHNSYEFGYIWTDAQLVRTTSTDPETRLTDLLGRPAKFLRRTDGQNTGALIIRINNGLIATNATTWFRNHRLFDQLRGYRNDVVINLPGLPADEAAAFAPKPSPQVYPTDFSPPDTAKGDSFEPPDDDKVLAWWDMSRDAKLNDGTFADGNAIVTLGTRFGNNWTLTPSDPAPVIVNDGLHHRRALNTVGSGRFLQKSTESSLRDMDELEVHIVAAMERPGASSGNPILERDIVTCWRENTAGRGWRIWMKEMHSSVADSTDRKVFADISFDGTASDAIQLQSPEPLGWDTMALFTLRYNGSNELKSGLQPGEAELVVNGLSDKKIREDGPAVISGGSNNGTPNTPLRIGAGTSSGGGASRGMRGRVAELAVLNSLSTYEPGSESSTGVSAQDSGELVTIRSYFRKKYGVW